MADDQPDVPGSAAELTTAWLSDALLGGGVESRVEGIVVEPLGPGVGFLGDVARVRLRYGEAAHEDQATGTRPERPETVIVKFPPADPGGWQVGSMLRVWEREQAFYTEIAPMSPGAQVPLCYCALGDPGRDRWVLVLEDCPSEVLDAAAGATRAQAEAAIDALATFHAHWWEADRRFSWMPGFDVTGIGGLQGPWLEAIPIFLRRYGHLIPESTDEWLQAFAHQLPVWSARAGQEALTIVHADYRLDNMRYHEGRMTMLDWQTALRGPGTMDLASFVATSLAIEDRRRWEQSLIDRYRRQLGEAGVNVDDEWLGRSYDENLLWWMGQFANNLARLEPEDPLAQAALNTMIERTYTAASDRNVGRLLSR